MKRHTRTLVLTVGCLFLLAMGSPSRAAGRGDPPVQSLREVRIPEQARVVKKRPGWPRMGDRVDPVWNPRVNTMRARGLEGAADLYSKVAPAVIVVKLHQGYGTGFFIDGEGSILTNRHVVTGAVPDSLTGIATVEILAGRSGDPWMELVEEPMLAQVYKVSEVQDLALLELVREPGASADFPFLELATQAPGPGENCAAIGHPSSGALWTFRTGQVTGRASFPDELAGVLLQSMTLPAQTAKDLGSALALEPRVEILHTDIPVNTGDSGGPLVNVEGQVLGVTFAMPGVGLFDSGPQSAAYHVALPEVRQFLEERPTAPLLAVADPWPDAFLCAQADVNEDGVPETLIFGTLPGSMLEAALIDVNQDTAPDSEDPQDWEFEFAFHNTPLVRTFYDTDNDGSVDLILTDPDQDDVAESVLRLVDDEWAAEPPRGRKMLDPSYFESAGLRRQFEALSANLQE